MAVQISPDSVWVLGAHMTRFARYPDRDLIDLASESALGALADGEVTVADIDVLACGALFQASGAVGQRLQKQIGQTGVPVYNVANACATGATAIRTVMMAIRAGEAEIGLAVGAEQMGKMGLLGGAAARRRRRSSSRRGATARSPAWMAIWAPRPCRVCSPRPARPTPTTTTAWASSSSPGWPTRTTSTRL